MGKMLARRKRKANGAPEAAGAIFGVVLFLAAASACTTEQDSSKAWIGAAIICPPIAVINEGGRQFSDGQVSLVLPVDFLPSDLEPDFRRMGVLLGDGSRELLVMSGHWGVGSFDEYEGDWRLCIANIDLADVLVMERVDARGAEVIGWFLTGARAYQPLVHLRSDSKEDRGTLFQILASVKLEKRPPADGP